MNTTMDKLLRPQTAQEAVRDLGRLEEVTLFGAQVYEFVKAATQPARYLRVLVLDPYEFQKSRKRGHQCSRTGIRPNYLIPSDIFAAGQPPCLLDLTLSNLRIDPSSPLLSVNLTSLTLGRALDHDCCPPRLFSLPILIEILRRTPLLTEFVMIDILTEPSHTLSEDIAQIMPVNLRHLQTLYFHGPWINNYRWFMRKLDYTPSLLRIEIVTKCNATEIGEQNNVVQLVPSDIASSVCEIEVSDYSRDRFKISGWRREAGQRSPHAIFSAIMTLEKSSGLALSQGVFAFCAEHRPSLLSLEHLRFSWNKASSGPASIPLDWAPLLRMLPGLRSITADYTTPGRDCIDIAGALAANTTVSGNTEFTCTNLRRLEFQSVALEDCLAEFLEALASVLELRHRHNINCEELWIGSSDKGIPCNGPADFEALRRKRREDLIRAPVRSR